MTIAAARTITTGANLSSMLFRNTYSRDRNLHCTSYFHVISDLGDHDTATHWSIYPRELTVRVSQQPLIKVSDVIFVSRVTDGLLKRDIEGGFSRLWERYRC